MIESVFLHAFKQAGAVAFGEWVLWRKSMNLWNMDTDEIIHFESLEEAYQFQIKGKTIKQQIDEADMSLFDVVYAGGSGSSGPSRAFKVFQGGSFDGGEANGPAIDLNDLPARVNVRVKTKNVETAIQEFRKMFNDSKTEHAISVDRDGFVNGFRHGGSNSVQNPRLKNGDLIVHNHPAHGYAHFSGQDLVSTSMSIERGVVATHAKGYYKLEKGTHFKAESFARDVKKLTLHGKDYNSAMDRWLKRNQRKYGYKYTAYSD